MWACLWVGGRDIRMSPNVSEEFKMPLISPMTNLVPYCY
jgi:hypothetical protein